MATEYQQHDAAVDTGTSPKVQYSYTDGSNNHAGPTKIIYPNGRILRLEYNSGDDDNLSRVSFLADDNSGSVGTHLAKYTYQRRMKIDYTEPEIRYDPAHGAGDDPYDGLDGFGRMVDLLWRDYGSGSDAVRIQYDAGARSVPSGLWPGVAANRSAAARAAKPRSRWRTPAGSSRCLAG